MMYSYDVAAVRAEAACASVSSTLLIFDDALASGKAAEAHVTTKCVIASPLSPSTVPTFATPACVSGRVQYTFSALSKPR